MVFQKGNPGKPFGAKGKTTVEAVDKIIDAAAFLEKQGMGLREFAKKDPEAFWTKIYTKLIPRDIQLTGKDGKDLFPDPTPLEIEVVRRVLAILPMPKKPKQIKGKEDEDGSKTK